MGTHRALLPAIDDGPARLSRYQTTKSVWPIPVPILIGPNRWSIRRLRGRGKVNLLRILLKLLDLPGCEGNVRLVQNGLPTTQRSIEPAIQFMKFQAGDSPNFIARILVRGETHQVVQNHVVHDIGDLFAISIAMWSFPRRSQNCVQLFLQARLLCVPRM